MEAHAWAESPLQVLGATEAFAAGLLGETATIHGRHGLNPVGRTLTELERGTARPPGLALRPDSRGTPRGPARLALGDALSGQAQRLLLRPVTREVVLLDDGRATRIVLQRLVDGAPMLRPQHHAGASRTLLARLATGKLRRLAGEGRLTVFTALDLGPGAVADAEAIGIRVVRHAFGWLRSQPYPEPPAHHTIVLGSALVANDLVSAPRYLEWVAAIALEAGGLQPREGGISYFAHRREDDRTLVPLASASGIVLRHGDLPVELRLRGLTDRHVVHSLPSTAACTLRLICPDATVVEHPVAPAWWLPGADPKVRLHLSATGAEGSSEHRRGTMNKTLIGRKR